MNLISDESVRRVTLGAHSVEGSDLDSVVDSSMSAAGERMRILVSGAFSVAGSDIVVVEDPGTCVREDISWNRVGFERMNARDNRSKRKPLRLCR
jgi:hypothetical protein